jgi:hypothetical protein
MYNKDFTYNVSSTAVRNANTNCNRNIKWRSEEFFNEVPTSFFTIRNNCTRAVGRQQARRTNERKK